MLAMAPSQSPNLGRRLSARRGSVSASDPWAKHQEKQGALSSSTLTIVRVSSPLQSAPSSISLQEPPRRFGKRSQGEQGPPSPRLSFAFSSFNNSNSSPNSSPASSPRLRPSSPTLIRSSSFNKPRLSPEQLYDLARQSTNPKSFPLPSDPTRPLPVVLPSSFTPLPDDIFLPFVDRAGEVAVLIANPPSAKLFALLQQTFPQNKTAGQNDSDDPTQWTYARLHSWLTETTREEVNDAIWVTKARKCILGHSELIWERIKGALGVPPELDVEEEDLDYEDETFDHASPVKEQAVDWETVVSVDSPMPLSALEQDYIADQVYGLSIEPLVSNQVASPSVNPPPLSLPLSMAASTELGLGDIAEGAEEDDEVAQEEVVAEESKDEEELIDPSQIHGIKFCTVSGDSPLMTPSKRSGSVSSFDSHHRSAFRKDYFEDYESDDGYNPVGDRAPGNPLFPSNFARLALGPTLMANNPALRSPAYPPPIKLRRSNSATSTSSNHSYTKSRSNSHTAGELPRWSKRPNRFSRGSDYAITIASGGSVE
ncbi:hypothetical protein C8J56DRAFT_63582 [Mycena floridula]|nr:hypothetical protein C8J56DRAFT_63582 [Mycena floridula]